MKKTIFLTLTIIYFLLTSCGGTKKTEHAISSGNYDQAFNIAVKKLTKDKNKNEKQVPLLKEAFEKATARDLAEIKRLKLDHNNPLNLEIIYKKYTTLDVRQDEIILLKPLYFKGKEISFNTKDYSKDISVAKKKYSDQLYNAALPLMNNSKENARKAFIVLEELQVINPNYRSDLNSLIESAKKKGNDYVFITLHNNVVSKLQDSTSLSILKSFSKIRTGDFTNKWVVLHDKKDNSVVYNYQADIYLDKITTNPEKTNNQVVNQEKEVQAGWNYKIDSDGNRVKDKNGNDIKTPKMEKITAVVKLYQQVKSTILDGKVVIKNLKAGTAASTNPLNGEAKLEHVYGTYTGDPKAIEQKYHDALNKKKATFPKGDAFNKFALQTFKQKVEQLLSQYQY